MRLITLNLWGGRLLNEILRFVGEYRDDTDIFCFQEVFQGGASRPRKYGGAVPTLYAELGRALPGFNGMLTDVYSSFGLRLAMFASENVDLADGGSIDLVGQKRVRLDGKLSKYSLGSKLQWAEIKRGRKSLVVAQTHGFWVQASKVDTPERIEQSERIMEFLGSKKGEKVLCGDFNLEPGTESVRIVEGRMRNLVKEYGITGTRSSHSPKEKGDFSDYVFVSKGVKPNGFRAMPEEVSDHLALELDFD
ncbi:MAG: endonuclease/exonuclease/phosphatase family protein [Candidatus Micrarchaeota archaeon]|nr:endonuclease/exonuclease/phosphatase family protein [Candidatus Micrarchaeota archaeon]